MGLEKIHVVFWRLVYIYIYMHIYTYCQTYCSVLQFVRDFYIKMLGLIVVGWDHPISILLLLSWSFIMTWPFIKSAITTQVLNIQYYITLDMVPYDTSLLHDAYQLHSLPPKPAATRFLRLCLIFCTNNPILYNIALQLYLNMYYIQ